MKDNDTYGTMQDLHQKNASTVKGLVITHFGQSIIVETEAGEHITCHLRRNQSPPLVGDIVKCRLEQEKGVVLEIAARRNILQRGDKHGQKKLLAANIDLLLIVMNPPPILSIALVDRYTIAAELLGITPVLLINKCDLLNPTQQQALQQALAYYETIGCAVLFISCVLQHGLQPLSALLSNKRAVLVGPSGVGKSSIIKQLTHDVDIQIGTVSQKGIGKHTTTATRLYHLYSSGELIDSPGVRDFQLWSLQPAELLQGFKEMQPYHHCRFRDCKHLSEPDCALRFAVDDGRVNASRYQHYCEWLKEIKNQF